MSDAVTPTGTDYPTRDGSGLRDCVHVWNLARAHVRAVEQLDNALERQWPTGRCRWSEARDAPAPPEPSPA